MTGVLPEMLEYVASRWPRPPVVLRDACILCLHHADGMGATRLHGLRWASLKGESLLDGVVLSRDSRYAVHLLRGYTPFGDDHDFMFCSYDTASFGHGLTRESIQRIISKQTKGGADASS